MLSADQRHQFQQDGFLILPSMASEELVDNFYALTLKLIEEASAPIEYEAELNYPGAPTSLMSQGGKTIRRIRQAYGRDALFEQWVQNSLLKSALFDLLGEDVWLAKAHHNCVMTKFPAYSSDSLWHQDLRYWSYHQGELITAWLALCHEHADNGCLQVIPGSHRMALKPEQFDEQSFFLHEQPDNQKLISKAIRVELEPGDVLLFHCKLLHAAMRNFTTSPKFAVVMTFRGEEDEPLENSRSADGGEVRIKP